MGAIGELLRAIAQFVPPWVLAIAGVLLAFALAPGWLVGLKVKRVKAILRKTVRADDQARKALQDEAFALARDNGEVLVALVREADKLNQPRLRDKALKQLKKLGTHEAEVRKLAKPEDPARDRKLGHPVEAAALIATLLESGALEGARARLDEALKRWPDDPGLAALEARLHASESVGAGTAPTPTPETP
ncbi:MAG: hypothetical protein H6737_20005 [Alphaproteobacteria bacterium]|nr:hypothetical protein [Alphaproteobacteria bacterium]